MAVKTKSTTRKSTRSIASTVLKKSPVSKRRTTKRTSPRRSTSVSKSTLPREAVGAYAGPVAAPQFLPYFSVKFEKMPSGIKWTLSSANTDAVKSLQRYFQIYSGSMVSWNLMQNGIPWFSYNFAFGNCKWGPLPKGVWYTCSTTDKDYIKALHYFVDLANSSLQWGCTFCLTIGGNPICCCYK
jgi:hypothetical protein